MRRKKLCIGLTGGIATGKSTLLALFAKFGAQTFDADSCVHELLKTDRQLIRLIERRFGPDVIDARGRVHRDVLGRKVFADKKRLAELERMVHPRVKRALLSWQRGAKRGVLVADIPLLFEKRWQNLFEYVVVAACPLRIEIERIRLRRRISRTEARRLIALQLPLKEKMRSADYIFDTMCSKTHIAAQVRHLMQQWTHSIHSG